MVALLYLLTVTHITIMCVTLFLHRGQAHRSVTFHPVIAHFMRAWLWLTTGMVTREWVAIHRKHHRHSDQPGDPHSPHVFGIWRVIFKGAMLYHAAAKDRDMVTVYGAHTPDDWVEQKLYTPHPQLGLGILLVWSIWLWGWLGFVIWLVQMAWIPFWAAGIVNGVGHWWGYCNGQTRDRSRNLIPWGIVIGGEELHNNHHLEPSSAKLSRRPWEFDIGWLYIRLMQTLRLAKVRS